MFSRVSSMRSSQFIRAMFAARPAEKHASELNHRRLSFDGHSTIPEISPDGRYVAYLSGDTGMHTEMKTVVHDYYRASLMELNLGPNAVTPNEAAYITNELVQPAAVLGPRLSSMRLAR